MASALPVSVPSSTPTEVVTLDTTGWPLADVCVKSKDLNTVRLIGIFDPHFSAHDPAVYKVPYWPIVKDTITTVIEFAKKHQVDAICWSGDLIHLKAPTRSPHWFVSEVIDLMHTIKEAGIKNVGIAGNHDIQFGSIERGLVGQPLHSLMTARCYDLLDKNELLIQADGFDVRVAGASYKHALAKYAMAKTKKGASYLVTLAHFWFGNASGEFFGEPIYGPDVLKNSETDFYMIGHHHEDQGVQHIDGKYYDSHGSISRTGSHANDLTRRPAASYVEITREGIKAQLLRPKMPEVESIMDLQKRAEVQLEKQQLKDFMEKLEATIVESDDPKEILKEMILLPAVKARVEDYIAQAEGKQ